MSFAAGFGLTFLCLMGIIFIFGVLGSIFWIWMLIDCLTKEPDAGNSKLVWVVVIFFLHFIRSGTLLLRAAARAYEDVWTVARIIWEKEEEVKKFL